MTSGCWIPEKHHLSQWPQSLCFMLKHPFHFAVPMLVNRFSGLPPAWLNLKTHTVFETENRTSCLTTVRGLEGGGLVKGGPGGAMGGVIGRGGGEFRRLLAPMVSNYALLQKFPMYSEHF